MANIIESIYKKIFNSGYDPENASDEDRSEAKSTVLGALVVLVIYTVIIFFVGRWSSDWFSSSSDCEDNEATTEQVDESDFSNGELAKATKSKSSKKKKSSSKKSSAKKSSSKSSKSKSSSKKSSKKNKKKGGAFSPDEDNDDDIYN